MCSHVSFSSPLAFSTTARVLQVSHAHPDQAKTMKTPTIARYRLEHLEIDGARDGLPRDVGLLVHNDSDLGTFFNPENLADQTHLRPIDANEQ